jgi:hypothetical protein
LGNGAIAGLVIGLVAFVGIVALFALIFYKKIHRNSDPIMDVDMEEAQDSFMLSNIMVQQRLGGGMLSFSLKELRNFLENN